MSLSFRRAAESDLGRLVEIHLGAFPDDRGVEARIRNFTHNPLGSLADLHVGVRDGQVVAHAFLFGLTAFFGGAAVPVGGIATVGVAAEVRGQGVARLLLDHLHASSLERGDAITILYPFRQAFYGRHGYVPVSPYLSLEVSPRAIPREWSRDDAGSPRPATGDDRGAIARLHTLDGKRRTGTLLRPEALWERKLLDERRRWFVLARERDVVGYAAFQLEQGEPHADVILTIDGLAGADEAARRRLVALAGAQRDQVNRIRMNVAEGDPLTRALVDSDRHVEGTKRIEHPLGTLCAGPMVRLGDVERAIASRGYRADGAIELRLPDRSMLVAVEQGKGRVLHPPGGDVPWMQLSHGALTAILVASLAPSAAAQLGWLTASDPDALADADALFALPPFFSEDSF